MTARSRIAMIRGALVASAVLCGGVAHGQPAMVPPSPQAMSPVQLAIECELPGRTKACPAFLRGFVDANRALLASPRSAAELVLYVSAIEVAQIDRLHLRFVSTMLGTPPVIEIDVDLDIRVDDDRQRAHLEPAFLRGVALYVASRFPSIVQIGLRDPAAIANDSALAKPWDASLAVTGNGDRTQQFQSYAGGVTLNVSRIDHAQRIHLTGFANGGLKRQPPLQLEDGTLASLDTNQWSLGGGVDGAYLLDDRWSLGGTVRFSRRDPKDQYRYGGDVRAGIEWDAFRADDPRGNRLAVFYVLGYGFERYNLRNEIGQTVARYAVHQLAAAGSVRRDSTNIGLSLSVNAQLMDPLLRHRISASTFVEWKLGVHVDLRIDFSITRREVPGPDPAEIDPTDYAQQSRLAYTQSLALTGALSLLIHLDRTNGQRNDRFTNL